MSLIKSICWNIQHKSSYISCKTFSNLNSKQCKKSYLLFLYCNIHTMEKTSNISMQSKRISKSRNTDEAKVKKDNNRLISTTAIEVSSADNGRAGSGRSSSLPSNIRRSRRLSFGTGGSGKGDGTGTGSKESTSKIKSATTNRNSPRKQNSTVVTVDYNSSHFAQNSFFAHPSSYCPNNYGQVVNNPRLAQYNVAPIPQRSYSDFVAHSLRKVYLFRDETNGHGQQDGGSQKHSSTNSGNTNKELQDKEIVRTLRTWMPAQITAGATKQNSSVEFTLMSYNVLAQDLLTGHAYLYRNHSPDALLWEKRWANLFEEIATHNADIICLQEVQESHLGKYYSQLNSLGYANVYKRKTGNKTDGCAIYYRKSMFKMIENTTVEYNQGYNVLDRDNVAILVKLAPVKHPKVEFVVATTHLLYNPRRQDVRLAQTQVLLAEIDRIAYKPSNPNNYIPVIVTGDFNSEPESAVYKLIVDGTLRYENLTHRTLVPTNTNFGLAGKILIPDTLRITDNCQHLNLMEYRSLNATLQATLPRGEELKLIHLRHSKRPKISITDDGAINDALFSTGTLSHELKLQSAFVHNVGNDTVGTTNQDGWITVDYIFYSGEYSHRKQQIVDGKLKLLARYSIPTTKQLLKVQNIPNFALGSDHLALLSKFRLEL